MLKPVPHDGTISVILSLIDQGQPALHLSQVRTDPEALESLLER